jgi:hypothetical protein
MTNRDNVAIAIMAVSVGSLLVGAAIAVHAPIVLIIGVFLVIVGASRLPRVRD